ncbi:MAG TPA: LPS export ABC transporter periplasmic protein LptC [Candidatus Hydrogenedens sp.]|nr:LPS export ABC transporter periplasmic protein LptC [Candidatus Hydrogenedens sp.]HOK09969.1 LPS export ABC transporter periplasmic protein LptC [Candidatus Hydrogenedens sp.]HOL19696.1 LPS export ABC transporter periplasmic protein LptC [Candidatus Hydrogenedens sp.]HPP59940.1 LPS export ABC transporter periplasmic protein LptC [Candidatus Hydrogenedens sp.]
MKWLHILLSCLLLLCSCSKKPSAPTTENTNPAKTSLESMDVTGVDLYHHDPRPTFGEARKPTLWLHAEKFSVIDENTWKVENIRATIYDTQSGKEHIKISAKEGIFEKMKSASLKGDVEAQMTDITFTTDAIEWKNRTETEPAKIHTQGHVELNGTDIHLLASSLIINADTKEFELEEVSGEVPLVLRNPT